MSERMKPILAGLVAAIVVNYVGVTYLFGPVAAQDAPAGPMIPPIAALIVTSVIFILFYDWVNQQVGHAFKSAMVVALSQILLVDVYYLLNGQRGLMAAGASAVVLLASWGAVGMVYGKLSEGEGATAAA